MHGDENRQFELDMEAIKFDSTDDPSPVPTNS